MVVNRVALIKDWQYRPGIYSNLKFSSFELYDTYRDIGMKEEELEENLRNWTEDLEEKLDASLDCYERDSCLYELGELYKVSKSKLVKKSIKKVYKEDPEKSMRKRAGKILGHNKLEINIHELGVVNPFYIKQTMAFVGLGIFIYGLYEFGKLFNN